MSVQPAARQLRPEDVEVVLRGEMPLGVPEYTREKVAHVSRLSGQPVRGIRAVVTHSADPRIPAPFRAEVTLDVLGRSVRAQGDGTRPREAVDAVVDRLERQLVRVTEKWQERHRWLGLQEPRQRRRGAATAARSAFLPRPVEERDVLRRKTFAVVPQTVDEAAYDMEALDHDFYLFVDAATGRDVLLYHRDDGGYAVQGLGPADVPEDVVVEPGPTELEERTARQRLDDGGEPFVFYTDPLTQRGHVVYRRYDGNYGVITPS
jgi:ribosomal subunit interface protein